MVRSLRGGGAGRRAVCRCRSRIVPGQIAVRPSRIRWVPPIVAWAIVSSVGSRVLPIPTSMQQSMRWRPLMGGQAMSNAAIDHAPGCTQACRRRSIAGRARYAPRRPARARRPRRCSACRAPASTASSSASFEVTNILDGYVQAPSPHPTFGANQPAEAVQALARRNGLHPTSSRTVYVTDAGQHRQGARAVRRRQRQGPDANRAATWPSCW